MTQVKDCLDVYYGLNRNQKLTFMRLIMPDIASALKVSSSPSSARILFRQIQAMVSIHDNISIQKMLSEDRHTPIVLARWKSWYIADMYRKSHRVTFSIMAELTGDKKESTIWHGIKSIELKLALDERLRRSVERIVENLQQKIFTQEEIGKRNN